MGYIANLIAALTAQLDITTTPDGYKQAIIRDLADARLAEGAGGGGGITQAEVTTAIQNATNLDQIETLLGSLGTYTDGLEALETAIRDRLNSMAAGFASTATVSRAANTTPYIANDVYGGLITLTNFAPTNGDFILTGVQITFNISSLPVGMGGFLLYLFSATPSTINDNEAFSLSVGDLSLLLAEVNLGYANLVPGGGVVRIQADNLNLHRRTTGSTVYGRLVTQSSLTPAGASETFKIETWQMAL